MNFGRPFIPNMYFRPTTIPINSFNPIMRSNFINTSNNGIFSKLISGIKNFNWKGLLSGTNRTLNVMNQTIPLIRQAKPMVNNVRSMVKLAKAFNTTTNNTSNNTKYRNNYQKNNYKQINNPQNNITIDNNNYPTFFVQ